MPSPQARLKIAASVFVVVFMGLLVCSVAARFSRSTAVREAERVFNMYAHETPQTVNPAVAESPPDLAETHLKIRRLFSERPGNPALANMAARLSFLRFTHKFARLWKENDIEASMKQALALIEEISEYTRLCALALDRRRAAFLPLLQIEEISKLPPTALALRSYARERKKTGKAGLTAPRRTILQAQAHDLLEIRASHAKILSETYPRFDAVLRETEKKYIPVLKKDTQPETL